MFMERLKRFQGNVLMGLFQTGVKMLGLGGEGAHKDGSKAAEIFKLMVSQEKAGTKGGGMYDKVISTFQSTR